ncbi:16S rRNA (uracil(1498)-N(3))-methyltransferase [Clostridium formicaceticum]|uniref:Ribosomal RNA small subunit methyltransferase E n=1 Tax=Clostridium formicaceticum TaxID=1497 RepID=A0AAC9RMT7_9CLOT|nr:16S rRNA (uracil(1498)-N(3))-methyltransferase [Clostridium formicaceticum]AOY77565.1 16S rRNA methyltransferase [Clostridium formicaceticum]ARE88143.1 Ribosomal RNA small subunit methyltransferase E [Clostridium formicaceticum]
MNRFFVNAADVHLPTNEITIAGEDVKHISKVLRLSEGDLVEVCDGEKYGYIGKIKRISKQEVLLSIEEQMPLKTEAPIEVILYQSIPKATKMELIIQKTTEMGIKSIVPIITSRTVVQFKDDKDKEKKVERWQKIAMEAAKQSKRGVIPSIHFPLSLKEALQKAQENDLNIIAYEKEASQGIKGLLTSLVTENIKKIGIWIGPEGGFEEEEIDLAKDKTIHSITLGPRILRTETAGFTVLSILMYVLGDLGG